MPVYLDAPLATKITEIFRRYPQLFNDDAKARIASGDDLFSFPGLKVIPHTGDSRALHEKSGPMIIIAGAGMSGGGRVRAHEIEYLPKESTTLLFVGYQAVGTLGRQLLEGRTKLTIDGQPVVVKASIAELTGYSGHADRDQLLAFVEAAGKSLEKVFVTMGEPKAELFLAQRIKDFLGVDAIVPQKGEEQTIDL
jgi:metallo-beta-lactamase family protein